MPDRLFIIRSPACKPLNYPATPWPKRWKRRRTGMAGKAAVAKAGAISAACPAGGRLVNAVACESKTRETDYAAARLNAGIACAGLAESDLNGCAGPN